MSLQIKMTVDAAQFKRLMKRMRKLTGISVDPEVELGYGASYAPSVHEKNRNYKVGEWKFLQTAVDEHKSSYLKNLAKIAKLNFKRGMGINSLDGAMLEIGNNIMESSIRRTPLDTGFLRATAYVAIRKGGGSGKGKGRFPARPRKTGK